MPGTHPAELQEEQKILEFCRVQTIFAKEKPTRKASQPRVRFMARGSFSRLFNAQLSHNSITIIFIQGVTILTPIAKVV